MTKHTEQTQTEPTFFSSLLDIVLMLIEAILSLVLRFDSTLRRHAYPLASDETVVQIRTYLPHAEFYATFSHKGVLLDRHAPFQAPDIVLNTYSHQLIGVLMGQNAEQIDGLQMRGDSEKVALFKAFLTHLGVHHLIVMVLEKVRPRPLSDAEKAAKAKKRDDKLAKLTQELNEQTLIAERLTAENRKLSTELKQIKGTQKTTFIALLAMSVMAFVSLVAHFFR